MIDQEKIHNQCLSEDPTECIKAIEQLRDNFSLLSNKEQAWNDLIKLMMGENHSVRYWITSALHSISFVPVKETDDVRKTDTDVRKIAASVLGSVFSDMPDKQKAWNDLHKLTNNKHWIIRYGVACAFGSAFFHMPDKQKAWSDLHKLTKDKNRWVRTQDASTISSVFSDVPDKQQAWNDLIKLTSDKESDVRQWAASAIGSVYSDLGSVFSDMSDKQQVWNDLIKLTTDGDWSVRSKAASATSSVFPHVPDKQQAWNDLIKLPTDGDSDVRASANHSLGKVSIFKASQAEREKDYKRELETAIEFFEKATNESYRWNNPAQFCLPFYRSFHTIVFKKQEAKEEEVDKYLTEVDKYLAEAKVAVRGSKSKEMLFETVNNLANALKEVQNLDNLDLEAKKCELNFYRKYCDRAAELMRDAEEAAPFATIAMRKGLPILDRNLKELLEEIQEKAKIACQASQGTPTQEIACSVRREVQKWEISSQEEMSWYVENLIFTLESTIPRTHKNQNFFDRISEIREEKDIVKQYAIVCTIIPLIPRVSMDEKINKVEQGIDDIKKGVGIVNENTTIIIEKLDEIQEELKKGFESLDNLSIKVGGTEGECLKIFSEKLLEITKKGDSETLNLFLEEVLKNEDTLTKEIESSSAPQKEKEESKGNISKLKSLLKKVKNPAKEFGKDVANEIVVSYTAKGIVELFLPIMSMAIFGVPIPSQIVDMLANVITELKN